MMRCESGIFSIARGNLALPISAISVQCQKYCYITKHLDTLVYVSYQVLILGRYCLRFEILTVKAKGYLFVRDKKIDEAHPICSG